MAFTFLHCADLHLGSPLLGLSLKDEGVAARFAAASREAFSDLVTRALEAKVAFVLIAGDVYDGEWRDTSIGLFFNREVARLARAGIQVFLIRGNHDAASEVTKSIVLPDNVVEFGTKSAHTHKIEALRVAIHGRSFPDREVNENWSLAYPKPTEGYLNIGMLHTSCTGRPGHATYAPCSPADLVGRGYDYWALGHVHEYECLSQDPWIVYPGNLQGRSVRECGAKGAVLVDVQDGRITDVRRLIVDRARWAQVELDLTGLDGEAQALRAVEQALRPQVAEADGRLIAMRLRLTGKTALHGALAADPRRWHDEMQAAAQRVHEDVWLERLSLHTQELQASSGLATFDLAPLLAGLDGDEALRNEARAILDQIVSKLPPGTLGVEADDIEALLAEAGALLIGRTAMGAS
jgi:DNA repair exonuclease SbcCD nuclease subunit